MDPAHQVAELLERLAERPAAPRHQQRAPSGSASRRCSASPRLIPSATSRACAPSCRSRSIRRSSAPGRRPRPRASSRAVRSARVSRPVGRRVGEHEERVDGGRRARARGTATPARRAARLSLAQTAERRGPGRGGAPRGGLGRGVVMPAAPQAPAAPRRVRAHPCPRASSSERPGIGKTGQKGACSAVSAQIQRHERADAAETAHRTRSARRRARLDPSTRRPPECHRAGGTASRRNAAASGRVRPRRGEQEDDARRDAPLAAYRERVRLNEPNPPLSTRSTRAGAPISPKRGRRAARVDDGESAPADGEGGAGGRTAAARRSPSLRIAGPRAKKPSRPTSSAARRRRRAGTRASHASACATYRARLAARSAPGRRAG